MANTNNKTSRSKPHAVPAVPVNGEPVAARSGWRPDDAEIGEQIDGQTADGPALEPVAAHAETRTVKLQCMLAGVGGYRYGGIGDWPDTDATWVRVAKGVLRVPDLDDGFDGDGQLL